MRPFSFLANLHAPRLTGGLDALPAAAAHWDMPAGRMISGQVAEGRITLAHAKGPDPDLMAAKARHALDNADIVVHDCDIDPAILALARPGARIVPLSSGAKVPPLERLLGLEADNGAQVVYIASRRLPRHLVAALRRYGAVVDLIPGRTDLPATQTKEAA